MDRPDLIKTTRSSLLQTEDKQGESKSNHVNTLALVGVHGVGGVGKSVTAACLGRDQRVQDKFKQRILWIEVGQDRTDPMILLQSFANGAFGREFEVKSSNNQSGLDQKVVVAQLKEWCRKDDEPILIILDDIWSSTKESSDVLVKEVLNFHPFATVLITSRDAELLDDLDCEPISVDRLNSDEALTWLQTFSGREGQERPKGEELVAMKYVAELAGNLPIALKVFGGLLKLSTGGKKRRASKRKKIIQSRVGPI